jgi:hypothetical protein
MTSKKSEPRVITEVIEKNFRYALEGELSNVILYLQEVEEKYKLDKYHYMYISIYTQESYGDTWVEAFLEGQRYETPEEVEKRLKIEKERKDKEKEKELKEFERLKAKYEKSKN